MPDLRTIDLTGSKLNVVQANALRELDYDTSIKIGIWFNETRQQFHHVGGQAFIDLPIRTIVYPSYRDSYGGYYDTSSMSFIANYCWTYDVEQLDAVISTGQQQYKDQLKALVLTNLATVRAPDSKKCILGTWTITLWLVVSKHFGQKKVNPKYMFRCIRIFGPGDFSEL